MRTHGNIMRLHAAKRLPDASFELAVREHLQRLLDSASFDGAARSREFLRFVVDEALAGRGTRLNQMVVAMAVFNRGADFDPTLDPIVRVQAGRLRRSLERYYLLAGAADTIRIELPKGRYMPLFVREPRPAPRLAKLAAALDPADQWPTVLLHPLQVSCDQEEHVASRVTDELAAELHRYREVRVVRQHDLDRLDLQQQSSSRFELRGQVHGGGAGCLVTVRLIDRLTAEQLWSDNYSPRSTLRPLPADADDIARVIAARIGASDGVIVRLLAAEQQARPCDAPDVVAAILRSHQFFFCQQPCELQPALEALQWTTAREPGIAAAWGCLARLYLSNYSFELCALGTPLEKAIDCAYRAAYLDPASAQIRCTLAAALLVKGELQAARAALEQLLAPDNRSLAYREVAGWLTALTGDWEQGLLLMRDAARRNPYCLPHVKHGQWANHLRCGDFAAAHLAALEYRDSGFFWREVMLASSLGLLGRLEEARAAAAELLERKPQFASRGRTLLNYYIKAPDLSERIVTGLRSAGLALS